MFFDVWRLTTTRRRTFNFGCSAKILFELLFLIVHKVTLGNCYTSSVKRLANTTPERAQLSNKIAQYREQINPVKSSWLAIAKFENPVCGCRQCFLFRLFRRFIPGNMHRCPESDLGKELTIDLLRFAVSGLKFSYAYGDFALCREQDRPKCALLAGSSRRRHGVGCVGTAHTGSPACQGSHRLHVEGLAARCCPEATSVRLQYWLNRRVDLLPYVAVLSIRGRKVCAV